MHLLAGLAIALRCAALAVAASSCADVLPPGITYTCQQQAAWGKCAEAGGFLAVGACDKSCGRCIAVQQTSQLGNTSVRLGAPVACTDALAQGAQYTCQQQASFGKCNDSYVAGQCQATCGLCSGVYFRLSSTALVAGVASAAAFDRQEFAQGLVRAALVNNAKELAVLNQSQVKVETIFPFIAGNSSNIIQALKVTFSMYFSNLADASAFQSALGTNIDDALAAAANNKPQDMRDAHTLTASESGGSLLPLSATITPVAGMPR